MDIDSIQNALRNLEIGMNKQQPPLDPIQKELLTPQHGLSGILYPPISSDAMITEEIVTFLRKTVDDKIDEEKEGTPRFLGDWIDGGTWWINFANFWTLIWFIKIISTWTFNDQPFEFRLTNFLPTYKYFTYIPGALLDDIKILQRLFKLNGLDTSKWRILDKRMVLGGFEVDFELDLVSALNLGQMNYALNFGMNQINFGLIETVEEQIDG